MDFESDQASEEAAWRGVLTGQDAWMISYQLPFDTPGVDLGNGAYLDERDVCLVTVWVYRPGILGPAAGLLVGAAIDVLEHFEDLL